MEEWNKTCQPEWNRDELIHKLEDAVKATGGVYSRVRSLREGYGMLLSIKQYGGGKCVIDRKDHSEAVLVEFTDGSFPGPVWLCWRHFHQSLKARKGEENGQSKEGS